MVSERTGAFIGALALALPLLLAGCSSASQTGVASLSNAGSQPSSTPDAERPDDDGLAFASCMRENGVDMPDPDPEGGFAPDGRPDFDPRSDTFRTAMQACADLRPAGRGRDRTFDADAQSAALDLAKCMRAAGFDFPDPVFDADGRRQQGAGPDRRAFGEDGFREAMAQCRESAGLPAPGGPAARGPNGGGGA